jgi:tetratricopeptide (TPR) repeat protein
MRYHPKFNNIFSSAVLFFFLIIIKLSIADMSDQVPVVDTGAKSPPDPLFDDAVSRGIALTFNDQFQEASVLFDSLKQEYPDHPAPYFFKAATYQNWMSSYRFNNFQKELEENIQITIDKGEALIENEPDAWLHFYVGAAYGYRAFYRFRKHNWIGAYQDGRKGVNNFKEAFELDSTLYDVYLGLGTYHYWRTAKSKFLRIITFWMPDKRELGLQQMEFAVNHGRYAHHEASYGLLISLMDYKKNKEALEILERVIAEKDTPNISDIYFMGRLLVEFKNWQSVEINFRENLQRIENYPYFSIGFQVECKFWIAKALAEQNKIQQALILAEDALQQSTLREKDQELEGPLESFDEIKNNLEKLVEELKK